MAKIEIKDACLSDSLDEELFNSLYDAFMNCASKKQSFITSMNIMSTNLAYFMFTLKPILEKRINDNDLGDYLQFVHELFGVSLNNLVEMCKKEAIENEKM